MFEYITHLRWNTRIRLENFWQSKSANSEAAVYNCIEIQI